jgi:hypothetical protein
MMKWWGLASEPMNVNYDAIDAPQGELPIPGDLQFNEIL